MSRSVDNGARLPSRPDDSSEHRQKISPAAWIALAISVLETLFLVWSNTSDSSGFFRAVFGEVWGGEILLLIFSYVLPLVIDTVVLVTCRGWRNRLITLSGIAILVTPIAWAVWTTQLS